MPGFSRVWSSCPDLSTFWSIWLGTVLVPPFPVSVPSVTSTVSSRPVSSVAPVNVSSASLASVPAVTVTAAAPVCIAKTVTVTATSSSISCSSSVSCASLVKKMEPVPYKWPTFTGDYVFQARVHNKEQVTEEMFGIGSSVICRWSRERSPHFTHWFMQSYTVPDQFGDYVYETTLQMDKKRNEKLGLK